MWTALELDPTALTEARLLAHWACQPVAAVGVALLEARDDFSHTNLGWESGPRALTGRALDRQDTRVGLRVADMTLLVLRGPDELEAHPLDGSTLGGAFRWLETTLGETLGREVPTLGPLEHHVPAHPVRDGAPFETGGAGDGLQELARWIANAHDALEGFVRGEDRASEVRLWPHHFDLASLITVAPDVDPERAKSINVGFSFGDGSYPQPYAYVSPWPYPEDRSAVSALDQGRWHTEGFFAAVYPGTDLVAGGAAGQGGRVEAFLGQAHDACRMLLGLPSVS